MIKEQGIIEDTIREKAIVRLQKSSACAHCKSQGSCHVSEKDMLVEVDNNLDAGKGDSVELSMPEGALLKVSALVYIFPIMALMAGAFLGGSLSTPLGTDQSLTAAAGGAVFICIAFCALKIIEHINRSDNGIYPRMTRIISSAPSLRNDDSI